MSWITRNTPYVKEYRQYRNAGRKLNHKIIDACLNETIIERGVRMLGLGKNHQLVLDSEDDLDVLMDFILYEIHQRDGENQIDRYSKKVGGDNSTERELLSAMQKAKIGLFKIKQVIANRYHIELENLIDAEHPVVLTDINFSQTLYDELIIFFRPVQTTRFTMTSGFAFVFPKELEQKLLKRWEHLKRKSDAECYTWFFNASKQSGLKTMYV